MVWEKQQNIAQVFGPPDMHIGDLDQAPSVSLAQHWLSGHLGNETIDGRTFFFVSPSIYITLILKYIHTYIFEKNSNLC